jgi:hypothetical protein
MRTIAVDFPSVIHSNKIVCDACHIGKQAKLPFPNNNNRTEHVFDLLHMDIWGPLGLSCTHSHKYFLTIVDDHSRHTWVHLMSSKFETRQLVKDFIEYVQTHFQTDVKSIRTDNGLDFRMPNFYASKGIIHQTSCVETPQLRYLLNVTRSLLFSQKFLLVTGVLLSVTLCI